MSSKRSIDGKMTRMREAVGFRSLPLLLLMAYAILCLVPGIGFAQNLIQNGSFEDETVTEGANAASSELGTSHYPAEGDGWGRYTVAGWSRDSSVWYVRDDWGDDAFPDGNGAYRIGGYTAGPQVLAQEGVSLTAGTRYRLKFDMWGENAGDPMPLDVRLTYGHGGGANILAENAGTGLLVVDGETTDGNDGSVESVTKDFMATVSDANYAIQLFADGTGLNNRHIWIDNIVLEESGAGYEIQNGSFEDDAASTNFTFQSTGGSELPGGVARYAGHEWGYYTASYWSRDDKVWHVHEYQESFPDGDYAYMIDADGSGSEVLAQGGLYLEAGKRYRLTFAMWGTGFASPVLDVRLAYECADITDETSGTGAVLLLEDRTTNGTDGDYENVTVDFVPTVTDADYALQFIGSPDDGTSADHLWIDNIQIEWLPTGTLISIR